MDLTELKIKKRAVGAALLLGATIFASSAIAHLHVAPDAGNGTTPDAGNGTTPDAGNGTTPDAGNGTTPDAGNGATPDAGNSMHQGTVTVQDINYDQILDIITTGGPGNILNVFLGNGDGTFNNIFQAGLGLGVQLGVIAEEDVPEITFYQNMMAIHLANTCCPDDAAGDDGNVGGIDAGNGTQIPNPAAVFCIPGLPADLFNLAGGGSGC